MLEFSIPHISKSVKLPSLCLFLAHLVVKCHCYNQNLRLYLDIDCVQFVDPLLHGFNVHLPESVITNYLKPSQLPLIYVTAIPLSKRGAAIRQLVYIEDIPERIVHLNGLEEKAWYYVCVEFENMHRRQRQGNTSTTCGLHRTLDTFGKSLDSSVSEVSLQTISTNSLEFTLGIDGDFEQLLEVYLEHGAPPSQIYHVRGAKPALRVIFRDLAPGYNYGRICVMERPILSAYTTLGRTIAVSRSSCHLNNIQTGSVSTEYEAQHAKYTVSNAEGLEIVSNDKLTARRQRTVPQSNRSSVGLAEQFCQFSSRFIAVTTLVIAILCT